MNNFVVYKSSAGSGKTYTLMRTYLSIVLQNPDAFRRILAITFTNKAANEIKDRILLNLKLIAAYDEETSPQHSVSLIAKLKEETGLDAAVLSERAARTLSKILHNYSDFAVSTIDSFVHRIIRAFSFDLKLSLNFEVEMDHEILVRKAVDDLVSAAGTDPELTAILISFIQETVEDDESWQISDTLAAFAEKLFREDAREAGFLPADGVKKAREAIRNAEQKYRESLMQIGGKALEMIAGAGLSADNFSYKDKGIYKFFSNLSEGEKLYEIGRNAANTVAGNKWLNKESEKRISNDLLQGLTGALEQLFRKAEALISSEGQRIRLLQMVRRQLYPMAVLQELRNRLEQVKKESNVVPIAEFNRIVASIVMEEPVPFIYERTGERFSHFMIDEFQDTSVLQWMNLLPLIENSLAAGGLSMIVGDGKQAIYRFRNGDVDQFVRLPAVHNPGNNPLIQQRSKILQREYRFESLRSNYRSRSEVVNFNNRFFTAVAPLWLDERKQVYDGSEQEFDSGKSGGLVNVEFYGGDPVDYSGAMIERVYEQIRALNREGYSYGDIAVLTRTNNEATDITVYLNNKGLRVISPVSLLLRNNPEVAFLVNWLRLFNDPGLDISRVAITGYLADTGMVQFESRHELYRRVVRPAGFYNMLERIGCGINVAAFGHLSLYDKMQELIRVFRLEDRAPLYLSFFLDEVLKVSASRSGSLQVFLEYWDQKSKDLSVVIPDTGDAVQLLTIHKSKGLEFPVVIFPYADWEVSNFSGTAWLPFRDEAVPDLKTALISINKKLEGTIYEEVLLEEKDKKKLDVLNLVYVAFTRASERLYIFTGVFKQDAKGSGELKSVTGMLSNFIKNEGIWEEGRLVYRWGDGSVILGRGHEKAQTLDVGFTSNAWHRNLTFASRAPGSWSAEAPSEMQKTGNLLHLALSQIRILSDVNNVTADFVLKRLIGSDEAEAFAAKLQGVVNHPDLSMFFSETAEVFAESAILTPEGRMYRPDRVAVSGGFTGVIDYKTGRRDDSHIVQVRRYANLLEAMGYRSPAAWLVYIDRETEVLRVI